MIKNREGKRVPQVTFNTRRDHEWVDLTSDEVFSGKTVVVFSLPGAFTPTCSSTHVPRYNQLAPAFREHGVEDIICVSVNDAFVMNEWQREQKADNINFLPDGNGDFSRGMDMLVAKNDLGFGERSWRYSMLVR
ncbi:MAG: peroxiredoxin, partial [Thiohalobacterales bacterium]|nr:peroxiredoxin [Thiohalobacterales bacterium]